MDAPLNLCRFFFTVVAIAILLFFEQVLHSIGINGEATVQLKKDIVFY